MTDIRRSALRRGRTIDARSMTARSEIGLRKETSSCSVRTSRRLARQILARESVARRPRRPSFSSLGAATMIVADCQSRRDRIGNRSAGRSTRRHVRRMVPVICRPLRRRSFRATPAINERATWIAAKRARSTGRRRMIAVSASATGTTTSRGSVMRVVTRSVATSATERGSAAATRNEMKRLRHRQRPPSARDP